MKSISQRLLITYMVIFGVTLGVMAAFLTYALNNYYFESKQRQLVEQGENICRKIRDYQAGRLTSQELARYVDGVADAVGARITALNLKYEDLSNANLSKYWSNVSNDNFYDIQDILKGETIVRKRHFGEDPNMDVVLVGMPVKVDSRGEVEGVVLLYSPLTGVRQTISVVSRVIWITSGLFILLAAILIYITARRISRPLVRMSQAAVEIAYSTETPDVQVKGRDEISQLAASFNYMKNRLAQVENMRRDLIANVSHELRTPLTTIRGFVGAILDGKVKTEQENKYLELVHNEAQRMSVLVNDLLLLAKMQSGNLELMKSPVSITDLVEEVIYSYRLNLSEKILKFQHEMLPGLPPVYADPDRLKQIIHNIVGNAVKHTPQGGEIKITYNLNGETLTTEISDTGSGIPEGELEMIFEKFYRVDSSRNTEGSGLGLSIVRQLVELHGGTVKARPNPNGGTIISFTLPVPVTNN